MLEGLERAGKDVPALQTRPDISGDEWLWEAFWELATCRAMGMSMGPIPWTAIHLYGDAIEATPFERILLHRSVREMDRAYLAHMQKRSESSRQSNARTPHQRRPAPTMRRSARR